jgi:ribosomal protein S12 methylthiotransferase accessory factor YcaO
MLFIESVRAKNPLPVQTIRLHSMPNELQTRARDIQEEFSGEIEVYQITSDLEIPTFLASLVTTGLRFFGSGAALTSYHAIERALSEAAQCAHAQEILGFKAPVIPNTSLVEQLPRHMHCNLNRGMFYPAAGYRVFDYQDVDLRDRCQGAKTVPSMFHWLARHLANQGHPAFRRDVVRLEDFGVCVSQVVIPTLERYYLLSGGLHVVPSKRGRERLRALEL